MENKPLVLLIEDEKDLSDSLKDGLSSDDVTVMQAYDGEEGLRKALEHKPYLILLDLYMPKMDGVAFLEELRKDEEYGAGARVMVLSNIEDKTMVDKVVGLNVLDYIIKSNWGVQEIADKVKFLISN